MSDPLPERLARAAMENAVQMKGLEASIALAIRVALDEAARVARQFALGAEIAGNDMECPESERRSHKQHQWYATDIANAITALKA